jgi:hypothetical protein
LSPKKFLSDSRIFSGRLAAIAHFFVARLGNELAASTLITPANEKMGFPTRAIRQPSQWPLGGKNSLPADRPSHLLSALFMRSRI